MPIWPSLPSLMIWSRASIKCGVLRRCVPTCTTRWRLRGGDHRLAFDHVDADRLLDVDVGSGLHGGDHWQGVPVIGGGNEHQVEVLFGEHLAVVAVGPRFLLRHLPDGDHFGRLGQHPLVHVAERDHFDGGDLQQAEQVALSIPPRADQPDPFRLLVGECFGVPADGRQGQPSHAGLQKLARFMAHLSKQESSARFDH